MTRYYYYITAGKKWDDTVAIFKVAVGSSHQGLRDMNYIRQYAAKHHYYFSIINNEVDKFAEKVIRSLAEFGTNVEMITARDLVRSLRANQTPTPSTNHYQTRHHQRMILDLNYRFSCNVSARKALSLPSPSR